MQSELTAVSLQSFPEDTHSPDSLNHLQHGHDVCRDQASGPFLFSQQGETGDYRSPIDPLAGSERQSSPPANRASQYEQPYMASPRRQGDIGFEVVSLSSKPRLSFDAFPNEVLTHILSHLPPPSLSSVSLVSHRFHNLVTTPHAWRIAFSRYFPGPLSLEEASRPSASDPSDRLLFDKRVFSRLTALASWRSEYILRTRLLRSLSRGKPSKIEPSKKHNTTRSVSARSGSAVTTYTSQLLYPISHLNANFGTGATRKEPLFIHGASEQGIASASDPSLAKAGPWGLSDHQMFRHFVDLFPGEAEYGLGSGDMVGQPNCMDVSQPFGMVYGEGCPQGRTYFISSNEQRGRFLDASLSSSLPQLGIPALNMFTVSTCAVWIAKSTKILKTTGGLIGMMSGSSSGVLTAYALGPHPTYTKRFERGEITAKWVLSPGVPIIAIAVDENYSLERHALQRVWAVILNALGEVFYLTDIPRQPDISTKLGPEQLDQLAWKTGRSVRWELLEASRRIARPDPFKRGPVDGSYSPRSSSDSMNLDEHQVVAETKEIERFMAFKPKHFRKVCEGWDMQRELIVDFAGDDGNGAGESIVVIARGLGENEKASIRRFTRLRLQPNKMFSPSALESYSRVVDAKPPSIFGGPVSTSSLPAHPSDSASPANAEWRVSEFVFPGRKAVRITCSALDLSIYCLLTADEDPLLSISGTSTVFSPTSSTMPHIERSMSSEIPGRRARYMAVGTAMGTVLVWDIRSPTSQATEIINSISPLRIIQTESPQVSCVALTSLYVVHGGNDGLVQAWDPLASSTRPIRTLHSRFSSRARRRLVQAEASILGVGNNYFAAGAICLDPDPTVLRGMVSLGSHLRYWSYSSSAADQYKSSKRRLRRSLRGSNSCPEGQRFISSGRGALQDFIEEEKIEMEWQKVADEKEKTYLSSRFGVDLLGPDVDEDQLIAYAQLLSEESYSHDALKRGEAVASSVVSTSPSDTIGANDSSFGAGELSSSSSPPYQDSVEDDLESDIAEAIRLSLLDERAPDSACETLSCSIYNDSPNGAKEGYPSSEQVTAESSRQQEMDDLELALQLSLAEQESVQAKATASEPDEFPILGAGWQTQLPSHSLSSRKDKGKARAV